jgi:N-acetylglucosamine-6-sulfatase
VSVRGARLLVASVLLLVVGVGCSSSGSSGGPTPVAGPGWVSGPASSRPGQSGGSAPNIVFVLTDDLTWNLVRYMPHVLAMQREGTTFSRYFVTDSLCCPSRASIFTGEFPHDTKVFTNLGPEGGFAAFVANHDEDRTFATTLQRQGYETGLFGKFLNLYEPGETYQGRSPYIPPGWSAWVVPGLQAYDEYGYTLAVGRQTGQYGHQADEYLTTVLSGKAAQFIEASTKARRPFFAEIATIAPHGPYVPGPQDTSKFPGVSAPRDPAFGRGVRHAPTWLAQIPPLDSTAETNLQALFRLRVQSVLSVDRMIGRLQEQVRALGIADNTYFVFSSDNGLHMGEHNLRLGKGTAFDTDINVPLIVTGPGVPAGRNVAALTENVDLAPTVESLAGAAPPATVDGRNLLPLLRGNVPSGWRSAVLVEHHSRETSELDPDAQLPSAGNPPTYDAIRTRRYLYVEYRDGQREFYDLKLDPAELVNRYAVMATPLRAELHRTLTALVACHGTAACWKASETFHGGG